MKSIGVTLQRIYLTKKLQKETLCDIQLSFLIFLVLCNKVNEELKRLENEGIIEDVTVEPTPGLNASYLNLSIISDFSQPSFTCSKLTIETLEKGV